MSKNSIIDYCSCILFRLFGPLIRNLPLRVSLFLGRRIGELFYYFDLKHKTIVYSNLKTAFGARLSPAQISNLAKEFYRAYGQNLIEIFFIPLVDKAYLDKYISIEGLNFITEGFNRGNGLILLVIHAGSWELSNIICANLGFPFHLFIRNQRYPQLNQLLNLYRSQKGCKIIQRQNQISQLIEALKNNEAVGMTADQGGKAGTLVKFLGKDASMPSGAIRLALKYDATLIPAFYRRTNGPYIKLIIAPPFQLKKTGNKDKDIQGNLKEVIHIFEDYILQYPHEYLWLYKIWKYTKDKKVLILNDGKTGHLRQAQAAGKVVSKYLEDKGINTYVDTVEVKFKNQFSRYALTFSSCLSGKYNCQGCLWCLRAFLEEGIYKQLIRLKPDIIISCGSSLAPINFILSRENMSKSIVIMRPSLLSTKRFDLVIMPKHDRPPKRKNVAVTAGALNLIDEDYLKEQSDRLLRSSVLSRRLSDFCLGLFIGGDTKNFRLKSATILEVIKQIKSISEKWSADILVSTSRRTSREIEDLLKQEFQDYPRCKLLIIANEKNIPEAVGGILALAQMVIVSPESISMVSEAAASGRNIIVFKSRVNRRHNDFLNYMAKQKYIFLCRTSQISSVIDGLREKSPEINILRDRLVVCDALKRII